MVAGMTNQNAKKIRILSASNAKSVLSRKEKSNAKAVQEGGEEPRNWAH